MTIDMAIKYARQKSEGGLSEEAGNELRQWIHQSSEAEYLAFSNGYIGYILTIKDERGAEMIPVDEMKPEELSFLKSVRRHDIADHEVRVTRFRNLKAMMIAVSFVFLVCTGSFFIIRGIINSGTDPAVPPLTATDPAPVNLQPFMSVSGGSMEGSSEAVEDKLAAETYFREIRLPDSTLRSGRGSSTLINGSEFAVQVVEVPLGMRYDVHLPDGSRVWLNAGSKLIYPEQYDLTSRKLEIIGEAFFDIKKDAEKSFIVKAGNATISVLGTRFNVNCYRNEPQVKITLVGGAVRVDHSATSTIMKPGEQTVISGVKAFTEAVDTSHVIAWKNGVYDFNNVDLYTIFREMERWNDIKVDYDVPLTHNAGKMNFFGSRKMKYPAILKMMRNLSVNIEEDGKTIRLKNP